MALAASDIWACPERWYLGAGGFGKPVVTEEQQLSHRQVYGLVGLEEIALKTGFLPTNH